MSETTPQAIAAYIDASNSHDMDALAACFSQDAVVTDEARQYHGRAAIREWFEDADAKYRPEVEVLGLERRGGGWLMTGKVSGSFPGSPVTLRFAFTLEGDSIRTLEIVQ